jgi:hypothetical protein
VIEWKLCVVPLAVLLIQNDQTFDLNWTIANWILG